MTGDLPDAGAVDYPEPFADLAAELCAGARRSLCLQAPALDHRVFDRPALLDAVSALARDGRQTGIRILVADVRPLIQRGHRLLALARRLPSSVQIRRLSEHPEWNGETVLIRDRDGLLLLPAGDSGRGIYRPEDRPAATARLELFDELWRAGAADPELRVLSL